MFFRKPRYRNMYIPFSILGSISFYAILRLVWISRIMPLQAFGIGFLIPAIPFGVYEVEILYSKYINNQTQYSQEHEEMFSFMMLYFGFWSGIAFLSLTLVVQLSTRLLVDSKLQRNRYPQDEFSRNN